MSAHPPKGRELEMLIRFYFRGMGIILFAKRENRNGCGKSA